MLKIWFLLVMIVLAATIVLAQSDTAKKSTTAKKAATAASGGPTKVTGPGTKTASGLEYWDIKVGTGATANKSQTVKVHYTGWLTNGKKFDSSVGGNLFQFTLGAGQVIKGWDEGVVGVKVGCKRQLRIPPDLSYGQNGYSPVIPSNSTLIFDVAQIVFQ